MKGALIAGAIGASLGLGAGFSLAISGVQQDAAGHDTPPPPKIVKVPQVVVDRVPGPTKYEVQSFPESCTKVVQYSLSTYKHVKKLDELTNELGYFVDNTFVPDALQGKLIQVNRDNFKVQRLTDQAGHTVYSYLNDRDAVKGYQEQCKAELEAAKEGDSQ